MSYGCSGAATNATMKADRDDEPRSHPTARHSALADTLAGGRFHRGARRRAAQAALLSLAACGAGSSLDAPDRWGTVVSDAQIVFMASTAEPAPGSAAAATGWELVVMNLDGSGRRQITHNGEQEFLPHFSPDGTRLVYTRFTRGGYGVPDSRSRVTVYDFATQTTRDLTSTGFEWYPVWSPDGRRIAFLSRRDSARGGNALWIMNADGSGAREVARPAGHDLDQDWGDIAWSSQDWILFSVGELGTRGDCFKVRLDKIRPDGTRRTRVTDGGPNCTPAGKEQSGDSDPGFSADGTTVYTSRGFPSAPTGLPDAVMRKLYAVDSEAWSASKVERDLSLPQAPSCVEGVPKGSPDGTRILLFRACVAPGERPGVTLTDSAGSYRRWIANGFGPAWNPAAVSR